MWVSNNQQCRFLKIDSFSPTKGLFNASLTVVVGTDLPIHYSYSVHGYKSRRGNTIGWTVDESNLCSVATYTGRLEYLANNDPVITTAYLLSRESTIGKTEVGFELFSLKKDDQLFPCPI